VETDTKTEHLWIKLFILTHARAQCRICFYRAAAVHSHTSVINNKEMEDKPRIIGRSAFFKAAAVETGSAVASSSFSNKALRTRRKSVAIASQTTRSAVIKRWIDSATEDNGGQTPAAAAEPRDSGVVAMLENKMSKLRVKDDNAIYRRRLSSASSSSPSASPREPTSSGGSSEAELETNRGPLFVIPTTKEEALSDADNSDCGGEEGKSPATLNQEGRQSHSNTNSLSLVRKKTKKVLKRRLGIMFTNDPNQGRGSLTDEYAKLLCMCWNSPPQALIFNKDEHNSWYHWGESWYKRFFDEDMRSTRIALSPMPRFDWFVNTYMQEPIQDTFMLDLAAASIGAASATGGAPPPLEYDGLTVVQSDISMAAVEVLDELRHTNPNCEFLVQRLCDTLQAWDLRHDITQQHSVVTQHCSPLVILLLSKAHYSMLITLDGVTFYHYDSVAAAPHEDYARIWVRRMRQLCQIWLSQDQRRSLGIPVGNFTFVSVSDRVDANPLSFQWLQPDSTSCLLYCFLKVSYFIATRFATFPHVLVPEPHPCVPVLIEQMRAQCRSFFMFITWYQRMKLDRQSARAESAATSAQPT
jgi:hypothetical protein